jgi:hypothetical protein
MQVINACLIVVNLSLEAPTLHIGHHRNPVTTCLQVVQVCAEHKKPAKLLKHLTAIKERSKDMRNPPRVLVFANRVKVWCASFNNYHYCCYACMS